LINFHAHIIAVRRRLAVWLGQSARCEWLVSAATGWTRAKFAAASASSQSSDIGPPLLDRDQVVGALF
jgi:hypothetical protein